MRNPDGLPPRDSGRPRSSRSLLLYRCRRSFDRQRQHHPVQTRLLETTKDLSGRGSAPSFCCRVRFPRCLRFLDFPRPPRISSLPFPSEEALNYSGLFGNRFALKFIALCSLTLSLLLTSVRAQVPKSPSTTK